MSNTISNTDNTIDSRDVIERIEELQGEREGLETDISEAQEALTDLKVDLEYAGTPEESESIGTEVLAADAALYEAESKLEGWNTDEREEFEALTDLQEQAEGYCPDWTYGAQLIRDSHFEQAMDEMISECYDFGENLPSFVTITVDYDALQSDYTSVEFDGETYWVR